MTEQRTEGGRKGSAKGSREDEEGRKVELTSSEKQETVERSKSGSHSVDEPSESLETEEEKGRAQPNSTRDSFSSKAEFDSPFQPPQF